MASTSEHSDEDSEEGPRRCVLCGEELGDATCSEHFERCFNDNLPVDVPPPPAKRQRVGDDAERRTPVQPLFGERLPYLPRELGILALDQSTFSIAELASMLGVGKVRPPPPHPLPPPPPPPA